ncbi:MAG: hypothetical protein A2Z71_00565 [Chloroflexi bacterium RBG_13_50_21]|nr:MAG: hypothetical protein A2Z71_00565 [Chloroflexi bacterium RBG_13_50_21]
MNASINLKKYAPILLYTPILVCVLIMLPRLISPQFGLMDDGRGVLISRGIMQGNLDLSWDIQAGRLRPVYWAGFAFWYMLADGHAFWYFLGNLIVFSATTWVLIRLVIELGGSMLQAWASGMIFALSPPVIENVYTLSKAENLQLFLLCTAIWLVVIAIKYGRGYSYWVTLVGALLLVQTACFTKESTLLMIPISISWWLISWLGKLRKISTATFAEKVTRWLTLISLLSGGVYYLARSIFISSKIIGVGQGSSFSFEGSQILTGLVRWGGWILRDFIWLMPMILVVLIWCLVKRQPPRSGLWIFAGVWMLAWLGVYIPWYFGAEYYLMPFTAGVAVLSGVLLVEIIAFIGNPRRIWKATGTITLGLTSLLFLATQANSYSDASVQLAQDAANTSVMEYVAENAPVGSIVLVNIQLANEYIEQMEFLLKYDYGRTDLKIDYYHDQDLEQLAKQYPEVLILAAHMENQPKMTVRMGLIDHTLEIWNSLLAYKIDTWKETFQVRRVPALVMIDFPRLICPVIKQENYCSPDSGLVNIQNLLYQWTVYTK